MIHQFHPAISGSLSYREGRVAHAQAGVAPVFDIALRTAEAADEEVAETFFGSVELVGRVERAEDVVESDLRVELGYESMEALFAEDFINIKFFHGPMLTSQA